MFSECQSSYMPYQFITRTALLLSIVSLLSTFVTKAQQHDHIIYKAPVVINDAPVFKDHGAVPEAGPNTGGRNHGTYGSQYARLLHVTDGTWIIGYTVSRQDGYDRKTPYGDRSTGGLELEIAGSTDNGHDWEKLATISEPGRDLDNAQLIEARNGDWLLSCRSVRWQESYILRVYRSTDKGKSWVRSGLIDSTAGAPGSLGRPDKGIYEPHLCYLDNGNLSVMYANERHVTEHPSYNQIISQKVSTDDGRTWGRESWVTFEPGGGMARPGMPVWAKMKNGKYIVVYEICGPGKCQVHYKTSDDGVNWPAGLGTKIPDQVGGPYITSLHDGRLLVTSNIGNVSVSDNFGKTWTLTDRPWTQTLWGSIYEGAKDELFFVNSVARKEGGNNIQIKAATIR
jgi:photosystem II stability/assembly factor-like uncharacterized protein